MEYRCIGCGAIIQTDDETKKGYVDKKAYEKMKENVYCKRCYSLTHYNTLEDVKIDSDSYLKIIQEIGKTDSLIVNVVDIFDFSGTFIPSIKRLTLASDVILVGNKRDLLPKSVKDTKITRWMRHMAKKDGVEVLEALTISAKSGLGIETLMDTIDKYRHKRNVYFVGMTNVGKSTLVNSIIKKYSDAKKDIITTSNIPGTTLDLIEIPYDGGYLIDTPGLINDSQITSFLSAKSREMVMPKKEIKPVVYQLNSNQSVFISGFAIMDYLEGDKSGFVFYFSNALDIHRTKLENKERIRNSIGTTIIPPTKDEMRSFEQKNFTIVDDGKKYDIVISGLGFICVKGNKKIRMEVMKGVGLYIRESVI